MHLTFFKHDMPSRVELKLAKVAADEAQWRAVCRLVDERDGRQCRCCDKRSNPDSTGLLARGHRHHIVYRSAGGPDASGNICTLCATCHNDEHVKRTLRIEGDPDVALTFWRTDDVGIWYVVREEVAVRVVRKD